MSFPSHSSQEQQVKLNDCFQALLTMQASKDVPAALSWETRYTSSNPIHTVPAGPRGGPGQLMTLSSPGMEIEH